MDPLAKIMSFPNEAGMVRMKQWESNKAFNKGTCPNRNFVTFPHSHLSTTDLRSDVLVLLNTEQKRPACTYSVHSTVYYLKSFSLQCHKGYLCLWYQKMGEGEHGINSRGFLAPPCGGLIMGDITGGPRRSLHQILQSGTWHKWPCKPFTRMLKTIFHILLVIGDKIKHTWGSLPALLRKMQHWNVTIQ